MPPKFQDFENERQSLPGVYARPKGRLLLARIAGEPAGTTAFRPIDEDSCEAKRLWVRPVFRGSGLGRDLLLRLMAEARGQGYAAMFADTLPSMNAALCLYRGAGFRDVPAYSDRPTPGAVYLRMLL